MARGMSKDGTKQNGRGDHDDPMSGIPAGEGPILCPHGGYEGDAHHHDSEPVAPADPAPNGPEGTRCHPSESKPANGIRDDAPIRQIRMYAGQQPEKQTHCRDEQEKQGQESAQSGANGSGTRGRGCNAAEGRAGYRRGHIFMRFVAHSQVRTLGQFVLRTALSPGGWNVPCHQPFRRRSPPSSVNNFRVMRNEPDQREQRDCNTVEPRAGCVRPQEIGTVNADQQGQRHPQGPRQPS